MKYVHTNIISHDWRKLVTFYTEVFQCEIAPPIRSQSGQWLSEGTDVRNAALECAHLRLPGYGADGPTLEIYQYSEVVDLAPVAANQRGLGHLSFEVDDVAEIYQKILSHGGSANGEIRSHAVHGVGIITFVYMRDPDGNLIEVQHWDRS